MTQIFRLFITLIIMKIFLLLWLPKAAERIIKIFLLFWLLSTRSGLCQIFYYNDCRRPLSVWLKYFYYFHHGQNILLLPSWTKYFITSSMIKIFWLPWLPKAAERMIKIFLLLSSWTEYFYYFKHDPNIIVMLFMIKIFLLPLSQLKHLYYPDCYWNMFIILIMIQIFLLLWLRLKYFCYSVYDQNILISGSLSKYFYYFHHNLRAAAFGKYLDYFRHNPNIFITSIMIKIFGSWID